MTPGGPQWLTGTLEVPCANGTLVPFDRSHMPPTEQLRLVSPSCASEVAYDNQFFDVMDRDARRSAQTILPLLANRFGIRSVVDFGCGTGEWLRVWKQLGAGEVVGVDGDYVDTNRLLVAANEFVAHDLRETAALGRRFDLVQSLEVGEHLPERCAESFVDMLIDHGDRILFSAAVPGQMGMQHINEQSYEYWREKFERRGFVPLDWIRPQVMDDHAVAFWYRYNTLLYVSQARFKRLPGEVQAHQIAPGQRVPDVSPASYRLRRAVTRQLPVAAVDRIVRLAHRLEERKLRRAG